MTHYCLVNHSLRFVACVDPMCGSNTVREWFKHSLPAETDPNVSLDRYLVPARHLDRHGGYRTIFFVRDPLRRLVSFHSHWVVRDQEHWCFADHNRQVGLQDATFREFVLALRDLADRGQRFQHHLQPQTRVLGSVAINDVVKLEDFDRRIIELNDGLGLTFVPNRRHASQYGTRTSPDPSTLRPAQLRELGPFAAEAFYDTELRDLVRSIYADDVAFHERH